MHYPKLASFLMIVLIVLFTHSVSLWSQEAPAPNFSNDQEASESTASDNDPSEKTLPFTPLTIPPSFNQTHSLFPPTSNGAPAAHKTNKQLLEQLPPTKHPIERKATKGASTYCGVFAGIIAGGYAGLFAADVGLASPLIVGAALGTGIVTSFAVTYCLWKFWNYCFKS